MGFEAACTVRVGRKSADGKALLESEVLLFRGDGDLRLEIPFDRIRDIGVSSDGKALVVRTDEQEARFELGAPLADRWARLIREPKGLFEKLELRQDVKVAVVDIHDATLLSLLRERTAGVVEGRVPEGATVVFFGAETREALRKLPLVRARMVDTGTLWVIRPKGTKAIAESDVFEALRGAGLADTKVVAVSRSHTAHKTVVPVELRGKPIPRPPIVSLPPPPPKTANGEASSTDATAEEAGKTTAKKKPVARARVR
jgi:hypothetical protein